MFFKEPTIPPEVAEYEEPVDLAELVGDMNLAKLDQIFKSIMKNRWTRLTRCVRSLVRSRRKKFHFRIRCCMWRTSAKHTEISASATFWKRKEQGGSDCYFFGNIRADEGGKDFYLTGTHF